MRRKKTSPTSLKLKPPYSTEVAAKPYLTEHKLPKFQKCNDRKDNTGEHVVRFLNFMGAHVQDVDLCLRKFSKSLNDKAYTRYVNSKSSMVHDWEHHVSLFNMNFFHLKIKFTFVELEKTQQYLGEDLDVYVKRFHEKPVILQTDRSCPMRCRTNARDLKVQCSSQAQRSLDSWIGTMKNVAVATLDKDKRTKTSSSKNSSFEKRDPKNIGSYLHFPTARIIGERPGRPPTLHRAFPSPVDQRDANYCP